MVPILVSIYYSCLDWNGIGKKTFVGFNNYIKLFGDSVFRQADEPKNRKINLPG